MDLSGPPKSGRGKDVETDSIGVQGLFLTGVVHGDIVFDGAGKPVFLHVLIADFNRGTVAVGSGDEYHLIGSDTVAQKPRIDIRVNKHSADMSEMQFFISVRHAACDNGPFRKYRPVILCMQNYRLL